MGPLVSILIPAYNAGRWIEATIRSALAQTWPHTEIIVVDDGSSDETCRIAERFVSPKLSVLKQANAGAAATRSRAFEASRGDYIQWLDADDLLAPEKIEKQVKAVDPEKESRVLLSSAWGKFAYRPERTEFLPTSLWCDLSPIDWLICKLRDNVYMQTGAWLVSRELTLAAGPWNPQMIIDDDGEYFSRVIMESAEVRFVREAETMYRVSGSGTLSDFRGCPRRLQAQALSMRLQIDRIRSMEDSERVRQACLRYLEDSLPFFFPECEEIVNEFRNLAIELGGRLEDPRLRSKYAWLGLLFGQKTAKNAQSLLPKWKASVSRTFDYALFQLGR